MKKYKSYQEIDWKVEQRSYPLLNTFFSRYYVGNQCKEFNVQVNDKPINSIFIDKVIQPKLY